MPDVMTHDASKAPTLVTEADISQPSEARVWNHWLGGMHNFAVDRAAGNRMAADTPGLVERVRTTRHFLTRAVGHLARDAGIRQFLDVGSGLPTAGNTHQIAQQAAPGARVVYTDHNADTVRYARELLTAGAADTSKVRYLQGDLRKPGAVLADAARTLDLSQPVAVVLSGILGHVPTHEEACEIVRELMAALPAGSYLLSHDVSDAEPDWRAVQSRHNASAPLAYHARSPEQIAGYFKDLDLVDPGIVPLTTWRPDHHARYSREWTGIVADVLGGIGRKP
jgi:hypothetical protein